MNMETQQIDATALGKVAVLMGGMSAEREISLLSGEAVLTALQSQGVDAHGIDVDTKILSRLESENYQRVFVALHGRGGEDGTIQGLLEVMNIPYTGSGVMASSLAMDKLKTKQIWQALELPTPAYRVLRSEQDCDNALDELGLPLIIKPVLEGSSIGMSKVEKEDEMLAAWQKAKNCEGDVIAESWVTGKEYTAAILDNQALPLIKLETTHKFYDYDAKYKSDDTQYICPCELPEDDEKTFSNIAIEAFNAVNASGWGRVDFMVDENNKIWLIEVNTVPGMTSHSLVPMAAKQSGISFEQLVVKILSLAECEHC